MLDSTLSAAVCFISVVLHELGHLCMLYRYHSAPDAIRLTLFDISISDRKKHLRSNRAELAVTLGGVAVNYVLALIFGVAQHFSPQPLYNQMLSANLTLGLFNSLPIYSLDGGQAFYLLLNRRFTPDRSLRIVEVFSMLLLIPCSVLGFLVLLRSPGSFTLLLTSLYLIVVLLTEKNYD